MKTFLVAMIAGLAAGLFTGCEHEHHEHGSYGRPAPYQYGRQYEVVPAPGYDTYGRPIDPRWR